MPPEEELELNPATTTEQPPSQDDLIQIGNERITPDEATRRLSEYSTLKRSVDELSSFKKSAIALTDEPDPGKLYDHAVAFLVGKGVPRDAATQQAREYLATVQQQRMGQQQGFQPTAKGGEPPADDEGFLAYLNGRDQQLEESRAEIRRLRARFLEEDIDAGATSALDSDEETRTMVSALKGLGGDTSLQTIRGEIKRQAIDNLRTRRQAAGGTWSDAWVQQETANAARQVFARYRSVIGDPAKLGRSPETDSGDSEISALQKKPPAPAPLNSRKVPEKVLDEYVDDQLLRGLASAARAQGGSRA